MATKTELVWDGHFPNLPNHKYFENAADLNQWFKDNHLVAAELWVLWPTKHTGLTAPTYLESVMAALAHGWVDGIEKRVSPDFTAQRFTPRKPKSRWTELNKERARQLIAAGLMTDAGHKTLPDLDIANFKIADDILAAIKADDACLANFNKLPSAYIRIRIDYIEERRRLPVEFEKSLRSFISKTAAGKLFGYFLPEIGIIPTKGEVISMDELTIKK